MSQSASALIMTGYGNKPVNDAGWPQGALAVANLQSRVAWWEGPPFGGGQWQFLYRGDTDAFNQALTAFAAIRAPQLDLVVHDGPEENSILKDRENPNADARVDWTFTVWVPASWHRLYNNPRSTFAADQPAFRKPVDPPRLDVYVGGGKVDWSKVKVPDGLQVRDERASAAGIKVEGGALLRAEVFDMATGKPVNGARVTAATFVRRGQPPQNDYEVVAQGISDASGRAQVEKIPAGTHRVTVAQDGYAPRVTGYERFREGAFRSFTVELARAETVRGQVLDSGAKPIPGVKIRADSVMALNGRGYNSPETIEVATGDDGRFELRGLPEGFTKLWASAPGWHYGDIFTIYDVPTTNITLRMARGASLHVAVMDKSSRPLARFEGNELLVHVEPKDGSRPGTWGGSAKVKDDGTVDFSEMPAGDYQVNCRPNPGSSARQYAPEQLIKLKSGDDVKIIIIFE